MTAPAETVDGRRSLPRLDLSRRLAAPAVPPTLVAIAGASAFLIVRPPVGDLWAARARESAASHGVGLTYWFSWFGGGSTPGNYSVLTPYLSMLFGSVLLGALATVAVTPLCWQLVRGSNHPLAATWTATVTVGFSLWSGRIPFAVGTAISVATLIAVRDRRRWSAPVGAVLAVLISPVAGVFIALGVLGTLLTTRSHRAVSATTLAAAGLALGFVAAVFGEPGPEGFRAGAALLVGVALVLFLLARPPRFLVVVVLLALVACPLVVLIPNGMGSNFQRLVWICLPVAVVATGRVRAQSALLAAAVAVVSGARGTLTDVAVARQPDSSAAYYASLVRKLDTLPDLSDYRVEVVNDGTHTAAFALLEHAALARGYETQSDNALNRVLQSRTALTPVSYRVWLDNNAVGYVAIPKVAVHRTPEYQLVSTHSLSYLTPIWSDANWTLTWVDRANPIVAAPGVMLDADQSNIEIDLPRPGPEYIRVRWSPFLRVDGPDDAPRAVLSNDGFGWTRLTARQPGRYTLHGSATGWAPE
jgi:hypothetical protein